MEERITNNLRAAFKTGYQKAGACMDEILRIEHVVWGILTTNNTIHDIINKKLNNLADIKSELDDLIHQISTNDNSTKSPALKYKDDLKELTNNDNSTKSPILKFESGLKDLINGANQDGRKVGVEDFFLKLLDTDYAVVTLLENSGITKEYIDEKLKASHMGSGEEDNSIYGKRKRPLRQNNQQPTEKSKTPILDNFGHDLTEQAKEGKLDPVIGRAEEIERVAQILSRRKKSNPILIGDPGVGKTAIVEGLAMKIIAEECPRTLIGKKIVTLDLTAMVAGTKYRGQFEERIKGLIDEVKDDDDIVLFIDEIHTMVGAGNSSGSMDAANIFKPALARGELQCIGATTNDEYRENIEKDGALDRRFLKVTVEATSPEYTLEILKNIKEYYEDYHRVIYSNKAILEMVRLSDRYISSRAFPDKAIDIMDEAGARSQLFKQTPQIIKELEAQLGEIEEAKKAALQAEAFEKAAPLRDKREEIIDQLERQRNLFRQEEHDNRVMIDENIITRVVAMMTGIPVDKISQDDITELLRIDETIKGKIIGQNEAVDKVAQSVKRNRTGVRKQNRPIGTFMFIGPTGVGKTELAKVLAKQVFGSEDALIRLDMSEYAERHTATKLIGAPPSYIGYNEGGQLTEKVRKKPYSVVLFDEIEKAHDSIYNILLQLLDEGRLTDSSGRNVNFKNTIIILTSNVGTKELENFGTGIGFNTEPMSNKKDILEKAVSKKFRPEFINRLDDIISFNNLTEENIKEIVNLQLTQLKDRLRAELGFNLTFSQTLKDKIAKDGYNPKYGAREIQRAIQKIVEDEISNKLLDLGMPDDISELRIGYRNDKTVISDVRKGG